MEIYYKIKDLVEKEKYNEALQMLEDSISREPGNIDLLIEKAKIYKQLGKYGDSINILNKVLKIEPEHKQARNLREMAMDILRSQQLDIYSSTNLSNDPWLDE
jgi:tetratricopeptide (TPR) repeat protein